MPPATENLSGRTIASYHLLERVGEGGTATVYRAQHPERNTCAVKILRQRPGTDPVAVKRFLREAGFGSRVQHPNVVRTYEYGEADGWYYLALEWATGEALAEYARREGPVEPELAAHIVQQLAGALAAAHAVGIIHRDLKPENIIFDAATRTARLLDFGIARDAQEDPAERLTRTGFFVGSLNYVAPEALSGALVGEGADIYSLATIAYYLLTGEHPHGGRSPREVFQQLLTQPARPIRQTRTGARLSAALEAVIMRSLSRDPAARHPSVQAFADDLVRALTAVPTPPAEPAPERKGGMLGAIRSIFGKKPG